ncbi:MAG: DDE-type integrase/transposase/recombinase [Solirubrobacteraceae bacterium]|jgi:transposase InsO family protein
MDEQQDYPDEPPNPLTAPSPPPLPPTPPPSTLEKRLSLIKEYLQIGGSQRAFCIARGINGATFNGWMKDYQQLGEEGMRLRHEKNLASGQHDGPYSPDERRQAVEMFLKAGTSICDFSRVWGVSESSLAKWLDLYQEGGPQALETRRSGGRPRNQGIRDEITDVKTRFPDFGLRKVKDFLFRYHGVKVSTGSVRNTLREKGLNSKGIRKRRKKIQPPRRFERSVAGDLWQSDITSFLLTRRHERVYLTVFLDDYSRYIVSWGLYLHQKQDIVTETLLDGIERFGKPKEVLTDQGRQYFAWRGKGDFQKLLKREGIQHVVARTHHPQTVGKTERFWATVSEEFWDRVQPQDFTEAKERFGHFVAHYNHFRPHQGIDGMVPADRFFGVENQVRQALEKAMSRNELHLALGEKPRKSVFLVGQVGDQQVSLHGESGRLIFQTQNGSLQEMGLEGLGAPGGKNGNNESGRADAGRTEETQMVTPQKPEIQDAHQRTQADESVVGQRDGRGETESAPGGGGNFGNLDGPSLPGGSGPEIGGAVPEGVADVPAGASGPGGGAFETAESQEGKEPTSPPARGRSCEVEKEDRHPGEGLGNDERIGGLTEGIPSTPGGESNS